MPTKGRKNAAKLARANNSHDDELAEQFEIKADMQEEEEYPNMLFVPLKTTEPSVPAREFVVYIVILVAFMVIVGNQYIETDFAINDGLQGMCGMVQF
jgi:hypothetical protein